MKILHVVRTLDPAEGGPPQVAARLAAAQAARGHDVHVVSYSRREVDQRVAAQLAAVPHRQLVHFHPVADPDLLERLSGRRARATLKQLTASADFVHIHGLWGGILYAAAATARRHAVPYCFRPAGMLDPWSLAQSRWKKRAALLAGYRAALERARFIHVLNDDERRLIQPLRLRAPAVVIPNGVFLEEIQPLPAPGTFRATQPALAGDPFVLFLSRLHSKKGLDVLAQAFTLLATRRPHVRLVVAGPDEGAGADFLARVQAGGHGDRVHVVGPLYGRDKVAALADAACFCLPSRQEGFSVAIIEALACGRPVVISEACHFPEVARAGAGRIVALDPAAVAAALDDTLEDSAFAARAGAVGAALVRERYTWDAIAEQCLALYSGGPLPTTGGR